MSVILHVHMDLSFTRLSQQFLWNLSTKEDKSAVSCTLHEGVIWGEGWQTVGMTINTHQNGNTQTGRLSTDGHLFGGSCISSNSLQTFFLSYLFQIQ